MRFDVIVIGGGHAGCEAAAVAVRKGVKVALVTMDPSNLGAMSCNPAIGGIGKGHLVREVDIFDGLIAQAADYAAIHYRMLNRSKGAAVRGPRVQSDRARYRCAIHAALLRLPRLTIVAGQVERLDLTGGRVCGVMLADGTVLHAGAIIMATGTFLGATLHFGLRQVAGGRCGERSAERLAHQIRAFALPMARLKTGTPPRLDGRSIDWGKLAEQPSDTDTWTMSGLSHRRPAPQIACGVTRTNDTTHNIILGALDRSPLFSGVIEGNGPRYCPSIEDKVTRFGDRTGHQVFLEPEGLDTHLVYPNGISTSLPIEDQQHFVRSIDGLAQVEIVQPGYAVEYDYIDPRSLTAALEVRALPGLFCAGQINGTTGYEEAAAQGLVAGLNAAAIALGEAPIHFDRADSYVGVMIDDLTVQGVSEPYRMLTARAEYRLRLRADNAASRLGMQATGSGAIGEARRRWIEARIERIERTHAMLASSPSGSLVAGGVKSNILNAGDAIRHMPALGELADVLDEVIEDIRYAPYLERQAVEVSRLNRDKAVTLESIKAYADIRGLSNEMVERLEAARPPDLAAAARIRGITPAALSAILVKARRRQTA